LSKCVIFVLQCGTILLVAKTPLLQGGKLSVSQ